MRSIVKKFSQLDQNFSQARLSDILLLCIATAACCFWLLSPSDIQLHMPDTTSYLRFDSYRGAGYPAFLNLLLALGLTVENIPIVQSILFFSSLCFLCWRFKNFFNSFVFAVLLLIGIGINPAITRYCFTLITESLFFASLFVFLGLLLHKSDQPSKKALFAIGACFCWLILIKPVSWAFICVPILLLWQILVAKDHLLIKSTVLILGFIVVFSAGAVYRYYHHQQWSAGSFMGNQLSGKLAFTEFDAAQTPYPEAGTHWLNLMKPAHIARHSLDKDYEKFLFSLNLYDYLRFDKMPEIIDLMAVPEEQRAKALQEMAFSIIKQTPEAYAYDVYLSFYNLWSIGELQNYQKSISYNKQARALTNKLSADMPALYILNEDNSIAPVVIKSFLSAAFILNIAIILYSLFSYLIRFKPLPSKLNILLIMSCSVHAYFLLTALLQAALTRYAIVAWPMHLIIVLTACLFIIEKIKQQN